MIFLYVVIGIYVLLSSFYQYKIYVNTKFGRKQKIAQSILLWILPFIGIVFVRSFLNYRSVEGSHKHKIPSWKRLIKYEDNGWG